MAATRSALLWQQLKACAAATPPAGFPADTIALFAPRDNVAEALQVLVGSARTAISIEMFTYCDATLDAIVHAKASTPGIAFQATFDRSEAQAVASMSKLVAGWAGDSRVVVGRSEHGQIIHRKILVVDHYYVASGSTNWTHDGEALEDNELVIRRGAAIAAWYEQTLDANHARLVAS
jgi:phosphatidylserine/phosphatidylglycerophosphate/cardiolipin synthase-like enzyme